LDKAGENLNGANENSSNINQKAEAKLKILIERSSVKNTG
jgi:hypothetical protein